MYDVSNIFQVPLVLQDQGLCTQLTQKLTLPKKAAKPDMKQWKVTAKKIDLLEQSKNEIRIALVGKYMNSPDTYLSVKQSLEHAAIFIERKLIIEWIEAEDLIDKQKKDKYGKAWKQLKDSDGILVPGGFCTVSRNRAQEQS